jgi:predicted DNA-binding transcriptional regulator AlpA
LFQSFLDPIRNPPIAAAWMLAVPRHDAFSARVVEELSPLIGKTATTIRTCATNAKYQHLIPRPFKLPHSRRLAWYEEDVLRWMQSAQQVGPPAAPRRRGKQV